MSVKIRMYKDKLRKDGTCPIALQAYAGNVLIKKTLFRVKPSEWDAKNNRVKPVNFHHVQLNELIVSTLRTAESRYIEAMATGRPLTLELLTGEHTNDITLVHAIHRYIDKLANERKVASSRKHAGLIAKVEAYAPGVMVSSIDADWLDRFFAYLTGFNSHNTAAKNISTILTALKLVKRSGLKVVENVTEARKSERKTTKDKLTAEELNRIAALPLVGVGAICRDVFMLQFYLRGCRVGDVLTLQHTNIQNGRIVKQTRKTDKPLNIEILAPAMAIIDRYPGGLYVLPLLTLPPSEDYIFIKHIDAKISIVNRWLKIIAGMAGIEKKLTSHVARHTFAYLADQSGMSVKMIQDILDHGSLKMTQGYLEDLRKGDAMDKAARGFFDGFGQK